MGEKNGAFSLPLPYLVYAGYTREGCLFALAAYKRVKLLTVVQCLFHGLIVQYLFHGSSEITLRRHLHKRRCPWVVEFPSSVLRSSFYM